MTKTLLWYLVFLHIGFTIAATVTYRCLANTTCGCSLKPAALSRIIGGEQADIDSWGWAASILVGNSHICGGSIISSTLILTAAHCLISLTSLSRLRVNIGSKSLATIRQQRSVSNIHIHRDYNSETLINDIAIVNLSSPIDMNDPLIALICLPLNINATYPPINSNVIAIGWGVLSADSKTTSDLLQQVTLQTDSNSDINCQNIMSDKQGQFCAGVRQGGKDTCQGDSGGPLMLFSDNRWFIVGITSYGTSCALADHPGVYTRVSYYRNWISCFLSNNVTLSYICNRQSPCGCSRRPIATLAKIVGGEPVDGPHSWGWMGSLRRDNMHSCGASLLTPWFAVTAAHCLNDIESLSRISLNFGITSLGQTGELRNITEKYIHPLYTRRLTNNDIAILRLDRPIDLRNSIVSRICLPDKKDFRSSDNYPVRDQSLVAIGWGYTDFSDLGPSNILRQVSIKAMDNQDLACQRSIDDEIGQFCAGYPDGSRDTCQGDSGGPVMLFKNQRWELVGITSYGINCGRPGFAGVYARVSYYDSFIQGIINSTNPSTVRSKRIVKNV